MPSMDTTHTPHDELDESPTPRRGVELPRGDLEQRRQLADSIDCLTTEDVCLLASVKLSTAEAWAKRGLGPPYVMLGNSRLYPREPLKQFIRERMREQRRVAAGRLI